MNDLVQEAEKYVVDFLNKNLDKAFVYHNLSHTKLVVEKTKELADGLNIDAKEVNKVLIAAWFHDTGYTKLTDGHEEESVRIATEFLKKHDADADLIHEINALIMATEMHHTPQNLLEKIISDADYGHIGSKQFEDLTELLRKEMELTRGETLSEADWLTANIHFLTEEHKYHTSYAAEHWQKQKGKNLAKLLKSKNKISKDVEKLKQKKAELKYKKHKSDKPERGIETMFRVTLKNHIQLSDIADTKANILLSVNAIIISLVLSTLVSKLDNPDNEHLIIPTIVFIIFTIASIILSILATRPNVTEGKFTREDVQKKKVNLLFFGNFHKMSLDDFEWAIGEVMNDKDYLYSSLTKDLYFLGKVLDKKYKILRITYLVFVIGIVTSVIVFAIAFALRPEHVPAITT